MVIAITVHPVVISNLVDDVAQIWNVGALLFFFLLEVLIVVESSSLSLSKQSSSESPIKEVEF